ncbi:Rossmann-like domain-containing protein, partial [Ancrocorticia populi]|uniref:Rossmann-like domain-containing protein n=1 Tax=Ancrocorticia populi TaxID=2175228 RepID=UPI003F9B2784
MNGRVPSNKWQLYDELIDLIPADITVAETRIGNVALVCNSAGGAGIASHDHGGQRENSPDSPSDSWDHITGWPLRDAAALVRSWDFSEASVGVAALNSWLNSAERLESSGLRIDTFDTDVFTARASELAGKKVAMIGHFSRGITALDAAELTVLERDPRRGDLPDSACEYALPGSDAVFITGMTVANKTLPRLLELSGGARIILTGASVPFAPEVFA